MSNFTPGPWELGIALLVAKRLPDGTAKRICECVIGPEAEANARLIAAAPDLLEACKLALQLCESNGYSRVVQQTLQDAIIKAEIAGR